MLTVKANPRGSISFALRSRLVLHVKSRWCRLHWGNDHHAHLRSTGTSPYALSRRSPRSAP
eukprot:6199744-Pleurochrysis_carterae.AAC.1